MEKLIIEFDANKVDGEFMDMHLEEFMSVTGLPLDLAQSLLIAIDDYGTRCYNIGMYNN